MRNIEHRAFRSAFAPVPLAGRIKVAQHEATRSVAECWVSCPNLPSPFRGGTTKKMSSSAHGKKLPGGQPSALKQQDKKTKLWLLRPLLRAVHHREDDDGVFRNQIRDDKWRVRNDQFACPSQSTPPA